MSVDPFMWDNNGDDDDDTITLIQSLLCARKVSVNFICINSFNPHNNSMNWGYHHKPIIQMRILWNTEVKELEQGHLARK